ncbi:TadE family type IV pilus minor pilin [Spirillospora sp. CA-253888]
MIGIPVRRDRGMVTAEIALALPVLVLITTVCLWGVSVASVHLACADAARSGARAAARGEALTAVRAFVAEAVPAGATITVHRDAETSRVEITTRVRAPVAAGLPPLTVHAQAIAATEPGADPASPLPTNADGR